jgi:general secretion pathway protein L
MSLLRIRGSLADAPVRCLWALVDGGQEPVAGEGPLAELPRRARRVQLVIPAAQVLITRARLPHAARRNAGSVLAYAVEDETAGEPDANHVTWLGASGDGDVLAVIDKPGLTRWRDALDAAGVQGYEIHCETLLLPWAAGEWSLAWNGREGFARTGEFEGAATDCGDRQAPPIALRLMLEAAQARAARPDSLALYTTVPDAAPDLGSWSRELGIAVRCAGTWDWRTAPLDVGVSLGRERRRWRAFSGAAVRLRPAAWLVGAALVIHAGALAVEWALLADEQRSLRGKMESRFRAAFPGAVAVVDPPLQMRRKLAEARHAAGQVDSGDFLPMLESVMAGLKDVPVRGLRILAYESGRMTLELAPTEEEAVSRIVTRLTQSGMSVERPRPAQRPVGASIVIIVRAS